METRKTRIIFVNLHRVIFVRNFFFLEEQFYEEKFPIKRVQDPIPRGSIKPCLNYLIYYIMDNYLIN